MKLAIISAIAIPALVSAHGVHHHVARQASSATTSSGASAASTSSGTSTVATPTAASATTAASGTTTTPASSTSASTSITLTFTLASENPTAIPLSDIVSGASSQPTIPISTTWAAGSQPTFLTNAPPLPNAASLLPANYPTLDKTPPTDSPQVQAWIQEVANSGVTIPNITATVAGGCPANPAAVADTSRCWWTCGGCSRAEDVTTCPDKLTWGLTYDDGPAFYTPNLLQYLDQVNLKTTFFVVGSRAISYPALLQDEYMAQHQIAVHTWSHPEMTTLTTDQLIAELGWSRKIIKDVTGVTPKYWRPPYGDVDDRVRAVAAALGLQTVIWTRISATATFDTGDFNIAGGLTTAPQVLNNWENIIGNATTIDTGFIVLEHDLFQQTVDLATGYILPDALAHQPQFNIKPVIECLNLPLSDAYVETNDNATNPPLLGSNATASGSAGSAQGTGSSAAGNSKSGAVGIMVPNFITAAVALFATISAFLL